MKLHHKISGNGTPVIILHGLFGMLDNWRSIARMLEGNYQCILVDLRNHGRSPHHEEMNFQVMSADIKELMDDLDIDEAIIIGHSMGGKVAMQFAIDHPDRISKLIVIDIATKAYPPHHDDVITAIEDVVPSEIKERSEAEQILRNYLGHDEGTIQFLMKNLNRMPEGGFEWKANMPVIIDHYEEILENIHSDVPFDKPALFIRGALSGSVKDEDWADIKRLFPQAQLITIANAGHWVHADQPEALINALRTFMGS
jgi:pimeloyl-ACP methyl ester carboxylesterase